ncbi:MAG: LytTR family DNA-binding domain-containing protein [Bacteroidota bacterium]
MIKQRLKTLVVDDELEAQKRLELHLGKFETLELLPSCQNGKEALDSIQQNNPDIVFLDVEMPEMNGLEVLKHCTPPFPYIIFVTAYNQYAVEAFAQNAVDYILKPYTFERINISVERAIDAIEKDRLSQLNEQLKDLLFSLSEKSQKKSIKNYVERIAVKSIGQTTFIPVGEIIHIEAADQYVEVHTRKKKHMVRESMDKLESILNPSTFFRTHRSHIVSLKHVTALQTVDKHLSLTVLDTGVKVKITNSRKADFKARMGF